MGRYWRIIFIGIVVFSVYHTIRDILQLLDVDSILATFIERPHKWCATFCNYSDYVGLIAEISAGITGIIVLKRNKVGKLGLITILLTLVIPIMFLLP